jgi:hypothetical protein
MDKPVWLEQGLIVWAEVADANGFRKARPGIIVSAPHERSEKLENDKLEYDVVAITSRIPDPLPDDYILLPWHPNRHPRTGLNRKCAAVCSWVRTITLADIHDFAGVVPGRYLSQRLLKIELS